MTIYYVRPNGGLYGSENGSDWNNAFDGMPSYTSSFWSSTIHPGDTIYVAGGTYTTNWRIEASGNSIDGDITIKRATILNHGTNIGWQDSFDNQSILTQNIEIWNEDYITVDGSEWNGIKLTSKSGYRISISPDNAHPSSYVTIKHIEVIGDGYNGNSNSRALQSTPGTSTTNLTIQYCNFHYYGTAIIKINSCNNVLIEHNEIYDTKATNGNHVDLIITYSSNGVIRYNKFHDTWHAGLAFADNSGPWYVYGNIIYQNGDFVGKGNLVECQRNTKLYFYNNNVVGGYHGLDTLTRIGYPESTGNAYNNIFFNNTYHYLTGPSYIHDYNWYSGLNNYGELNGYSAGDTNPFVDITNNNYHLISNTPTGLVLDFPYNVDIDGITRGLDGIWDRGTYEYKINGDCPTPIVTFKIDLI